ncbi:hypothetical protein DOTSEDRAFT_78918 [Dothistroma septosporum NZE10]|uniref:Uncharacterized protein n=1 Tax=Dothistroma septosporum (strain NZE10 / CBS 128990) TaxID=675120 RepID=N1PTN4_DOTSN|nr:hypothetical protein DOTSEDRAFT_78918 [Dothistroma septosporum NZE10]
MSIAQPHILSLPKSPRSLPCTPRSATRHAKAGQKVPSNMNKGACLGGNMAGALDYSRVCDRPSDSLYRCRAECSYQPVDGACKRENHFSNQRLTDSTPNKQTTFCHNTAPITIHSITMAPTQEQYTELHPRMRGGRLPKGQDAGGTRGHGLQPQPILCRDEGQPECQVSITCCHKVAAQTVITAYTNSSMQAPTLLGLAVQQLHAELEKARAVDNGAVRD